MIRGPEIKVIRKAPMGDLIEFLIKGYNLSEKGNKYLI